MGKWESEIWMQETRPDPIVLESGLIYGSVTYQPDPLDPPAEGNVLICCSRPQDDVVIDI
jgi:hypothetical protein